MKRSEIEEVSISIITRVHERYEKIRMDDAEYIPIIKAIIQGAIESGEENELSELQINKINSTLVTYAKGLYIQGCLIHSDEDSNNDNYIVESGEWFKYIYEHGKYPE